MTEGMRIWYAAGDAFAEKSVTPATVNECDQAAAQVITDAMAADKAEIARLREALRDMADVVAVYAAQPLAPTRQRDRFHQDQWDQLRQGTAEMLAAALEKTDV